MKQLITSAEAPPTAGPYSPGLAVGDLIFLAGQGGFDPATGQLVGDDITGQTAQAFRNVEVLFAEFNAAWGQQFPGPDKPVRTTVRADLAAGMLIEVTVIAVRPGSGRGTQPA
jgi:2-iminobutanoate/2-iminopropanoate deaminase